MASGRICLFHVRKVRITTTDSVEYDNELTRNIDNGGQYIYIDNIYINSKNNKKYTWT